MLGIGGFKRLDAVFCGIIKKRSVLFNKETKIESMKLNVLDTIAIVLVVIGGLNWGFVALGYNLVTAILGSMPWLVTLIYILVGLSAIYLAVVSMKLERK